MVHPQNHVDQRIQQYIWWPSNEQITGMIHSPHSMGNIWMAGIVQRMSLDHDPGAMDSTIRMD